jgi:hypothetical protein
LDNHYRERRSAGRAVFASALAYLEPRTEDEHNAQLRLLDAIATDADGDDLRKAKVRFRDAMLLGTWQSPALGISYGSGTLQGPLYGSRYERETIDPAIVEAALQDDKLRPVLFRSVASAELVCSHIRDDNAGLLGHPSSIERLQMLDQEMTAIWLPNTDARNVMTLRQRLIDVRRLGAAPTISQLFSAYLDMEILPLETSWHRHRYTPKTFPDVRSVRDTARFHKGRSRSDIIACCEGALLGAHQPYLEGINDVDCVVTPSGMAALASILAIANEPPPNGRRVGLGIGRSCYYENRRAVRYFADTTDICEFDERSTPTRAVSTSIMQGDVLMLMELVSNSARTTFVGPFTGWATSHAHDLPVTDALEFLRSLTAARDPREVTVAIDASMSGPGPWLRVVVQAVKETGVRLIVWSSLQKQFMSGEDWSTGGFILNIDPGRAGSMFSTRRLRKQTDLNGIPDEALVLVTREANNASGRAQRIGAAAGWLASQLDDSSLDVLHPASRSHLDRHLWHQMQRPAVPFVLLRLGYKRSKLLRAALMSSELALGRAILERDSFGFSQPTISDIFPGQPDEIVRVSPGDPAEVPTEMVLDVLRGALKSIGL